MLPLLTRHILVWTTNSILWLIIAPFGIYNLCVYHEYRGQMALNKRHHSTVLCLVIFILIFWTIERGYGLIWSSNIFESSISSFIGTIIHYLIFPFTIYGILWSLVWRFWTLYYDIKLARSTSHSKWKSILNPKNDQTAWFIVNTQTFGNDIWTFKFFTFLWLIISILSFILHLMACIQIYSQRVATLLDGALNILSFLVLCIIWWKTPKFEDKLWIRHELKIMIYAYITLYICYFFGNLIAFLAKMDEFLFNLISSWIAIIITTIFVYISTRWILNMFIFDPDYSDWNSLSASRSVTFSAVSSVISSPKQSMTVSDIGINLKLYQLLADNNGLNCFMDHLISEFSHECLLCFIEMVQWKTTLNDIIMENIEIFENHDIEQILLMNQMLHKMNMNINDVNDVNGGHEIKRLQQIELSQINNNNNNFKPMLVAQNSQSVQSLNKDISLIINSKFNYKLRIFLFQFPDKVPLSSIVANWRYEGYINRTNAVFDDNHDLNENDNLRRNKDDESLSNIKEDNIICDYKLKAFGLFQRYIYNKNGCDMEINIHYGTRNKLVKLMNNFDEWMNKEIFISNLYCLFDECIEEMYRLMIDSFKRFKGTEEFMKLDKEIFSSIKNV